MVKSTLKYMDETTGRLYTTPAEAIAAENHHSNDPGAEKDIVYEDHHAMVLVCDAIIVDENYRCCGKPARWIAEWSDRQMIVCDEHRSEVQSDYDNDNEYDKTGITWTRIVYHSDMEV